MKHIKLYEEFVGENSQYIANGKLKGKVYHSSGVEITKLTKDPMWFALEKEHSDAGWFQNMIDDAGAAFQYEASVVGKIGDINDPDVIELFNKIGEDAMDWGTEIVGNPSATDVMQLKGTRALIKAGYSGIIYLDYDPRDFQADLEALLVFNPAKDVKNFKLIRKI